VRAPVVLKYISTFRGTTSVGHWHLLTEDRLPLFVAGICLLSAAFREKKD
jgi:hypothetical protein